MIFFENTKINNDIYNESMKGAVNDKGEKVPEACTKCGSPVRVYIQGEPVYLCTNCKKYFGTVPFYSKKKKKKVTKESSIITDEVNDIFNFDII